MLEEKESFWKKKGFYLSACVLLVGVMAVGAVCYRKANFKNDGNMMADIATAVPEQTGNTAGKSSLSSKENKKEEAAQANAKVAKNTNPKKEKKSESKKQSKKKETKVEKKVAHTKRKAETTSTNRVKHSFDEEAGLLWPVKGDVIMKYSMSNTVYFKTLAQYKCNPAIMIATKVGTNVKAAADCRVTKVEKDHQLGTLVTTDIGDKYKIVYGQLDNVSVNKGDELSEGDIIGSVAKPTKYYTKEGSNLYFQVREGEKTVDPLLLLR